MAEDRKIRWFFKRILSFNIELGKLRLPLKFVRSLDNKLPDTAELHTPDKRVWKMKVVEDGSHVWLEDGFGHFARHYFLEQDHQVHFEHKSKSKFSVRIFDRSACEITYLPLVEAASAPPKPKIPKPQCKKKHDPCDYQSDSRFKSPRHFDSTRPHFKVMLQAYSLRFMYVPSEFSRTYFMGTEAEDVELDIGDGRQWKVALNAKYTKRVNFGKGWNGFCKEYRLKEGDVCIFELLKESPFEFTVYIFAAV